MLITLFLIYVAVFVSQAAAKPSKLSKRQARYHYAGHRVLKDEYIVHFHSGHSLQGHFETIGKNLSLYERFHFVEGSRPRYLAKLDKYTVHELVRRDPRVKLVEHNVEVFLDDDLIEEVDELTQADFASRLTTRDFFEGRVKRVAYNLPIMQSSIELTGRPVTSTDYYYIREPIEAGQGTNIYILDTGIDLDWYNFGGYQAKNFQGFEGPSPFLPKDQYNMPGDVAGHGTHVASNAGAYAFGVAPGATLINVKCIDDRRRTDFFYVAKAIDAVRSDHDDYRRGSKEGRFPGWRGSVINMSFGQYETTEDMKFAVRGAIYSGIIVVAAAGNNNTDAAGFWPCSHKNVICVGGVGKSYTKFSISDTIGSNFGPRVNVLGPAVSVVGARSGTNDHDEFGRIMMTGTSMAAPHIAGAMAIWTSWEFLGEYPEIAVSAAKQLLLKNALNNVTTGFGSSTPNILAGTGIRHPDRKSNFPYVGASEYPRGPHVAPNDSPQPGSLTTTGTLYPAITTPADPIVGASLGTPITTGDPTTGTGGAPLPSSDASPGSPVKAGTELRILPLGDSITWGFTSTDGNGYRLRLLNDLSGDEVVFAGTQRHGTMQDNWNEGYPGRTIQYIQQQASTALNQRPNIVLLMAGTNDMNPDESISDEGSDPGEAVERLGVLIDRINTKLPDTVVLVAQLPGVNDGPQHASNVANFNALIPGIVQRRINAGFKVATVGMERISGSLIRPGDVHPTDQGYLAMADIWFSALHTIPRNWITLPIGPDPDRSVSNAGAETPGTCPFDGNARGRDFCTNTPIYVNNGITGNGGGLGPQLFGPVVCRSIPGDGREICQCRKFHDYNYPTDGPSTLWNASYADEIGGDCSGLNLPFTSAVRLADMDGDGLMDYLFVQADSSVLGFETIPNSPNQARVGYKYHQRIAKGVPGKLNITYDFRHEIQFADLNGDGLADYIWTHPNGRVEAWFNAGTGWCNLDASGFRYQGTIATGIGQPGYGVHHVDVNGDRRADYVYVAPDGTTTVWINRADPGFPGGIRYENSGQVHGPKSIYLSRVAFADITGKGTVDYLMIESDGRTTMDYNTGPTRNTNGGSRFWHSHGVIATGAGPDYAVLYGDLNGDGRAEYNLINATNSAIGTFFASCPDSPGDPGARGIFCNTAPFVGDTDDAIINQFVNFCYDHRGDIVRYNSRVENVGPRTSVTILPSQGTPDTPYEYAVDAGDCIDAFKAILNKCKSQATAGTYIGLKLTYIIYRY